MLAVLFAVSVKERTHDRVKEDLISITIQRDVKILSISNGHSQDLISYLEAIAGDENALFQVWSLCLITPLYGLLPVRQYPGSLRYCMKFVV